LGFGHPNQGAADDLNFIPIPDGGFGGTLTKVNYDHHPNEVMYASFGSGEYRHILSWDELDAFNVVYGTSTFTFTEVPSGGDIIFKTWKSGDTVDGTPWYSGNLAITHDGGTSGSVATGSTISSATISYSATPPVPIGFASHMINWTITCNSLKTHSVHIQTSGSDNLNPIAWWNNDGDPAHIFFGTHATPPTGTPVGPDNKNDVTWTWTLPGATAATDIPAGTAFHPGLALDVDDWVAVNCVVFDITGINLAIVPIMVADQFEEGLVTSSASSVESGFSSGKSTAPIASSRGHELTYLAPATNSPCSIGFSLVTTEAPQTTVSKLQFADVTGLGLSLSNLNEAGLTQLQASNLVVTVTNFGTHTLGAQQRFIVLLQGGSGCLPDDVATNNNYLLLNRPDLVNKQLFLAWQSTNSQSSVNNFAFVGEPPTVALPTLNIALQKLGTNITTRITWPQPSTGFVLQQNSNLLSTNWVTLSTVPTVTINPATGVAQNQVSLSTTNRMFYRLAHP